VALQDGADFAEEVRLEEDFVRAAVGPDPDKAGIITVADPAGDLLDDGLFKVD